MSCSLFSISAKRLTKTPLSSWRISSLRLCFVLMFFTIYPYLSLHADENACGITPFPDPITTLCIPAAIDPSPADCDTELVEDSSTSGPRNGRIPVIFIHGINLPLFQKLQGQTDLLTEPARAETFGNLASELVWRGDFAGKYKIYRFEYRSSFHRIYDIAKSLRNRIDQRISHPISGFEDFDIDYYIVAHSMGGLIARSYMEEHDHNSGKYRGLRAGIRIIRLITLATPHHGTPLANGDIRVTIPQHHENEQAIQKLYRGLDRLLWRKSDYDSGTFSWFFLTISLFNPDDKNALSAIDSNRAQLRADDNNLDWTAKYYYTCAERNDWLINLNTHHRFSSKITAVYAQPGQPFGYETGSIVDMVGELVYACKGGAPKLDEAITAVSVLLERILRQDFYVNIPIPDVHNDGVVPEYSAKFDGGDQVKGVRCLGVNHITLKDPFVPMSCSNNGVDHLRIDQVVAQEFGLPVNPLVPQPILGVSPDSSLAFGTVQIGRSFSLDVTVSNTGTASLLVKSIGLTGSADFSVQNQSFWLDPGDTRPISVTFLPSSSGAKNATLTISNNSINTPTKTISVVGTGEPANSCTYSLSSSTQSLGPSGGNGGFTVTTGSGCKWTAMAFDTWLNITSPTGGNGTGTQALSFTAEENPGSLMRIASISVKGGTQTLTFIVSEDGSGSSCSYSLQPNFRSFDSLASSDSFAMATASSCGWSVSSNSPWITLAQPGTKLGTLSINYSVSSNPATSPRTGTIGIQGQGTNLNFTISQAGANNTCTYSLQPTETNATWPGGAGYFQVQTQSGCSWQTNSSESWMRVTGTWSGSGSGYPQYSVDSNSSSSPRTGFITVKGETQTLVYTVQQDGKPQVYPKIYLPLTSISMGDTLQNSTSYQSVVVQNLGQRTLYPGSVYRLSGSTDFSIFSPLGDIEAGETGFLVMAFTPTSIGSEDAVFRITCNDPDNPTVDFSITGTGITQNLGAIDFIWADRSVVPEAVRFPAVATIGSSIYVLGGSQYRRYDPSLNVWYPIQNPPYGHSEGGAAAINGKIYLAPGSLPTTIQIYDPVANSWSYGKQMSVPRDRVAVATVNGKMYVIGGHGGGSDNSTVVEEYDPQTDAWTRKTDMPTGRSYASAAALNGLIYVIGGTRADGVPCSYIVEVYNPTANTWAPGESMWPSEGRFQAAVAVLRDKIYMIGGRNTSEMTLSSVLEFDPSKPDIYPWPEQWAHRNPIRAARYGAIAASVNDKIYVIGGANLETGAAVMTVEEGQLAAAPIINVPVQSVDLGSVPFGSMSEAIVMIQNSGYARLNLEYHIPTGDEDYNLLSNVGYLDPGQSGRLRIRFRPTTTGIRVGTLQITSNDPHTPTLSISLSATCTAATPIPNGGAFAVTRTMTLSGNYPGGNITIDAGKAYLARYYPASLWIMDLASGTVTGNIAFSAYSGYVTGIPSVTSDQAFVPIENGKIAVADLINQSVSKYVSSGPQLRGSAIGNNKLFITSSLCLNDGSSRVVYVYNLPDLSPVAQIPVGKSTNTVTIDPETGRAFVSGVGACLPDFDPGNNTWVIDTVTNSIIGTVDTPHGSYQTAIEGGRAYVLGFGIVHVVDISSLKVLANIAVDENNYRIAVTRDYIFLLNGGYQEITILSTQSNTVVASLSIDNPIDIASDPVTETIYVVSAGNKISEIRLLQPSFSFGCTPTSLSTVAGGSASSSCTVASIDGFNNSVTLGTLGLPNGTTGTYNPGALTPPADGTPVQSTLTVSLPGGTTSGLYSFQGTATDGNITRTVNLALTVPTCAFDLQALTKNFGASGGTGTVTIYGTTGCGWTASSNNTWITITSAKTGTGNGSLDYSVAANTGTTSRTGTMTIAGLAFTVTQDGGQVDLSIVKIHTGSFIVGINGVYTLNISNVGSADTTSTITVTDILPTGLSYVSGAGTGWSCSQSGQTITCTNPGPIAVSGSSSITLTVGVGAAAAPSVTNTATVSTNGDINPGNNSASDITTVINCVYSISPPDKEFGNAAGKGSLNIIVSNGCSWTASSNAEWITINSGGSGNGNGSVDYSVSANDSPDQRTTSFSMKDAANVEVETAIVSQVGTLGLPSRPTIDLETDNQTYHSGNTILVTKLLFKTGPVVKPFDWLLWFKLPDGTYIQFLRINAINLPPNLTYDLAGKGPIPLLTLTTVLPSGNWEIGNELIDNVTGEMLSLDIDGFVLATSANSVDRDPAYLKEEIFRNLRIFEFLPAEFGEYLQGFPFTKP